MKPELFSESLQIKKYKFNKESIKEIENNVSVKTFWPLIYIISDSQIKEAYVGESTNAMSRISNHLLNVERNKLTDLHLITSDKFNKSATLDIESNLIKYISGDGKYKLQNGNAGLTLHNYYQQSEYLKVFDLLWSELKKENIALKSIKEIDNSDLFKYSPYKSLTNDQYLSVEKIASILTATQQASIFVEGSAGTGKTILAIFLIKLLRTDLNTLYDQDGIEIAEEIAYIRLLKEKFSQPKVALVIPMTSLRNTLKKVFKNIKGLNPGMVIGPSEVAKEKYDILLVDEAHRLRRRVNITNYKSFDDNNKLLNLDNEGTELDWILLQSKNQIFFYDDAQSIKPSDIIKDRFDTLIKDSAKIKLQSQLRVKGGEDYISYVHDLLNNKLNENSPVFKNKTYDFVLFESLPSLITQLNERESEFGLCRLVAGYSWEWKSKNKDVPDIEIENLKLKWNSESSEWINTKNAINEVGCIHTTQGYDLNYTGIIFGKEITYDPQTNKITVLAENYHDRNGKNGIKNPETLKAYIINIYKTLMYRGIQGTYIYACDKNLLDYFKKHIPLFEKPSGITKTLSLKTVNDSAENVPFYDISVAAGSFSESQHSESVQWIKLPAPFKANENYFVCKVKGESMNKKIPNGSLCLFQKDQGGTREGKIVLVQHFKIQDSDFGLGYTVKVYHSKKQVETEGWSHQGITLKALSTNVEYKDIFLTPDETSELKVIGLFIGVL